MKTKFNLFIFSFFVISLLAIVFPFRAKAEVAIFRFDASTPSHPNFHRCLPISLTENLSARVVGTAGPSCDFDVEVRPLGEWVSAGGYFDSPPYAWDSNSFYSISAGNFSFTCRNNAFTLDEATLPSYVTVVGSSDLTATATNGPGKKYSFRIANSAQASSSFNMNFGMSSSCTMYRQDTEYTGVLETVSVPPPYSDGCNQANVVNINPRRFALSFPVRLGTSCGGPVASNTPAVTLTPTPPSCNGPCQPELNNCPQNCPFCLVGNSGGVCKSEPTPTPPSCGDSCNPTSNTCPNLCPACRENANGRNICQENSTPTPTPPSCGDRCTPSSNVCPNNCPACLPNSNGRDTCQVAPSPTPTPPSCNGPCQPELNNCPQNCPFCLVGNSGGVCKSEPTPTPPSCGDSCNPTSNTCPNLCPACRENANGRNVCQVNPSPTPTPPSCATNCTPSLSNCPQLCPVCRPGGNGVEMCQVQASPTPTQVPVTPTLVVLTCGQICNIDRNECGINCPMCDGDGTGKNVCQEFPTATPTRVPPTPTNIPSPTNVPSPTNIPTPTNIPSSTPPLCNGPCQPSMNNCPFNCGICASSANGNICLAPSPTPTSPPVCGGPCVPGVDTCPFNCPLCTTTTGGNNVCLAPTSTPVPTDTPIPSNTPIPTDTPTPTITPTPAPMCGNTCVAGVDTCPIDCPQCAPEATSGQTVCRSPLGAQCNCDGFTFTGNIAPGNTVTFTDFASVDNPDSNNAEVRTVDFHIEQDGVEIGNSGAVAVSAPQRTTNANGNPIDRYQADWSFTIPGNLTQQTTYRAYAKISCGYKNPQLTPQSVQPNLLQRIWDFILDIFGVPQTRALTTRVQTVKDPTFEASQPASYRTPTPSPTPDQNTVKLGTFDPYATPPPYVAIGCKQMIFSVNPN